MEVAANLNVTKNPNFSLIQRNDTLYHTELIHQEFTFFLLHHLHSVALIHFPYTQKIYSPRLGGRRVRNGTGCKNLASQICGSTAVTLCE